MASTSLALLLILNTLKFQKYLIAIYLIIRDRSSSKLFYSVVRYVPILRKSKFSQIIKFLFVWHFSDILIGNPPPHNMLGRLLALVLLATTSVTKQRQISCHFSTQAKYGERTILFCALFRILKLILSCF